MANEWHVKWIAEGYSHWNKRRKKVAFEPDLSDLDFFSQLPPDFREDPKTSRYFEKFDFSGANLTGSNLSNLNFTGANFTRANLSGANLSKSNFSKAKFVNADLTHVNASRAIFDHALFEEARLDDVILNDAEMNGAMLIATPISDSQQKEIAPQAVRIYTTRNEYQEAYKVTSPSSVPRQIGEEDNRSSKFKYDVYYGTSRCPVIERGALVNFDGNTNDRLSFGLCEVIVPDQHRIGRVGSWLWRKITNRADSNLKLSSIISLDEQLFWNHLISTSDRMTKKARPTVYIHGYNTTFETAVLRSAEIGHGLGLGFGIGLFSWASKGEYNQYLADGEAVNLSKYFLADFLEGFIENGSDVGINVIAHSMGCRCLLGAIEELASRKSGALPKIHQIIMAAADVNSKEMPYLAPHAVNNSERITSYVSDKDIALQLSSWLHSFPRVGYSPPIFLLEGIDTILVNDLDLGDFSHNYLVKSRTILADIFGVLKHGLAPDDRHAVDRIESEPVPYWKIRP
jgi:esterase/lipase superfamily enzyme